MPNVKDMYYERSIQLFKFLDKQPGIGLITNTVNRETTTKLNKVVIQQLPPNTSNDIRPAVLGLCWDELDKRLALLESKEVDADCLCQMKTDVFLFYAQLKKNAGKIMLPKKFLRGIHVVNQAQLSRLKNETTSPED